MMPGRRSWMLAGIAILVVVAVGIWQIRGDLGHTDVTTISRATYMLQLTNAARIAHGIHRVQPNARAARLAKEHAERMAAAGQLFHSKPRVYHDYRVWGENIGKGASVYSLFKAFMHSPEHRSIILAGKYDHLGVGFATAGGHLWVTMVFFG